MSALELGMISSTWLATKVDRLEQKLFSGWKGHGAKTLLHICGDSAKVLDLYSQTGADIIEVDRKVDLATARRVIDERACVIGNVDPGTVLLQGAPERVRGAAEDCLAVAVAGDSGGYILGSACIVPRIAPLKNVRAMVDAVRQPVAVQ